MEMEQQKNLFIPSSDFVESDTYRGIVRLHEKLKDLQAEVNAKLDLLSKLDDDESTLHKQQLSTLLNEVNQALDGIHEVTELVISDADTKEEFLLANPHSRELLREINSRHVQEVTESVSGVN